MSDNIARTISLLPYPAVEEHGWGGEVEDVPTIPACKMSLRDSDLFYKSSWLIHLRGQKLSPSSSNQMEFPWD